MKRVFAAGGPVAIAALSLACLPALAKDKTDGLWRGTAGAALAATSGNTSTRSLSINVDAARATTTDKLVLAAFANYGRNKTGGTSTTTADKWAASGQYDYNLGPRSVAFGRLGLESDGLADLDLRTAVAVGLGYKLMATRETQFTLYGGLGYTTDKYGAVKTINGRTGDSFSRASAYLAEESVHRWSPTVEFKQRLELYPGLSGDKARLAKFTAGLSVAMSSTLNLTVGLVDNYNSKPAPGQKKNDLSLFTGVNMKFGAQ